MNIVITGGAGYIGSMLINYFSASERVSRIIVIDLLEKPGPVKTDPKTIWIKWDLADDGWQEKVLEHGKADLLVHCAFRIRNKFGKISAYQKNNLKASANVFKFCFENWVEKLIYLSSVAAYGAKKENIGKLLDENHPLEERKSPYGFQKKLVEETLVRIAKEKGGSTKSIVLRLSSVTGPYGQNLSGKFGLITIIKKVLPFVMELDPSWARQFLHEKDLVNIISKLSFGPFSKTMQNMEIFNVAPDSILTAKDMAKVLNKKTLKLPVWFIKVALAIVWPISFGKLIPPSSINSLVYPINVNGKKVTDFTGVGYAHTSKQSLLADN